MDATMLNTLKTGAEIAKLVTEAGKLNAETMKLHADTVKLNRETRWFPYVTGAAIFGAAVAAAGALFKLFV